MPNIVQVLKEEIRRLAKKETKALTTPMKQDVVKLKKLTAALRKHVRKLSRDNDLLLAAETRRQRNAPVIAPQDDKARITGKGIRSMRRKLRVSQMEFGKLVGVSPVTIFLWEKKNGALRLKDRARMGLLALRGVGAREAKGRLELMAKKAR